ncbi:MAG: nitrite reductase (NAD(P)H), partial [Moraxellaceae bacterium]
MKKHKILVVGNGMVGHKFIDNIIQHPQADLYEVITFAEEPRLAYDRVQLSKYFSGSTADDLMLTSETYYQENGIKYLLSEKVTSIDTANNSVVTTN